MRSGVVIVFILGVAAWSGAAAQQTDTSLADAARQKKATSAKAKHVITDDDIRPAGDSANNGAASISGVKDAKDPAEAAKNGSTDAKPPSTSRPAGATEPDRAKPAPGGPDAELAERKTELTKAREDLMTFIADGEKKINGGQLSDDQRTVEMELLDRRRMRLKDIEAQIQKLEEGSSSSKPAAQPQ